MEGLILAQSFEIPKSRGLSDGDDTLGSITNSAEHFRIRYKEDKCIPSSPPAFLHLDSSCLIPATSQPPSNIIPCMRVKIQQLKA